MKYKHYRNRNFYCDNSTAVPLQPAVFHSPLEAYNYFTRHQEEFGDKGYDDEDGIAEGDIDNREIFDLFDDYPVSSSSRPRSARNSGEPLDLPSNEAKPSESPGSVSSESPGPEGPDD